MPIRAARRFTLSSMAALLCLPTFVRAECVDYENYLHWIGGVKVPTWGTGDDIVIDGSLAYVAADYWGFHIVDVSNPRLPAIVGNGSTPGDARGIAQSGSYAYIADNTFGLQLVDVSNPASPSIVGSVDTPGNAEDVAILGSSVFVADGSSGLQVINVSNPNSPQIVGKVNTTGYAYDVVVSGITAYVADGASGLRVIDVSNPNSPHTLGSVDTPGSAQGLALSGSLVYVADGISGVQVVDVSDPATPAILGGVDTPGTGQSVALSGSMLCVGDGDIQMVDVSNPALPLLSGRIKSYDPRSIVISNSAVNGSLAYVASGPDGMDVYDVSHPESPPAILGRVDTSEQSYGVAVQGTNAYVTCAIGPCNGSGYRGVLRIVDVSDPTSPIATSEVCLPNVPGGIDVSGTWVYVADREAGLLSINPGSGAGGVDTPGLAYDVAVSGNTAYVADGPSGLQVVDISNPSSPAIVGSVDTPGTATKVVVSGNTAYLADYAGGLQVVDVSNPALPAILTTILTPDNAQGVGIAGSLLYVAEMTAGVQVFNVTSPASPTLLSRVDTYRIASGVAPSGPLVYVADYEGGVQVIDVSNPSSPKLLGGPFPPGPNSTQPGRPLEVAVATNCVCAANSQPILVTVPLQCPNSSTAVPDVPIGLRPILGSAIPNPTWHGSSKIPFVLPKAEMVRVRILDVSGREVRTLIHEIREAGSQSVEWDGRGKQGVVVPGGMYFYQLITADFEESRTLVRLK